MVKGRGGQGKGGEGKGGEAKEGRGGKGREGGGDGVNPPPPKTNPGYGPVYMYFIRVRTYSIVTHKART
jgi:hypothetical protein